MRRANGTGTICVRDKNKYRKPYAVRTASYMENGVRVYGKYLGYFRTRKEALECLAQYSVLPYDRTVTFKQVYNHLCKCEFPSLKTSTVEGYEYAWKHLTPLYDKKIADIKTANLQAVISAIDSDSMQDKTKSLLKRIYKYAVQNDIVFKDYAKFIQVKTKTKTDKEPFTDDEILRMFDHCDDKDVQDVLILIFTGYRIGEFLSRRREDIDIENEIIYGGNKTDLGKRKIMPIHPFIIDFIRERYDSGKEYPFSNIDISSYRKRHYSRALKLCDIPYRSPHTCRHTFAHLLTRTASPNELQVSRLLGHSKFQTTADWYTVPDIQSLRNEIAKV